MPWDKNKKVTKIYLVNDPESMNPWASKMESTWKNDPLCLGAYYHEDHVNELNAKIEDLEAKLEMFELLIESIVEAKIKGR